MNYVAPCFFAEVGRCLCIPVSVGSGNSPARQQTDFASIADPRLNFSGSFPSLARPIPAPAAGDGQGTIAMTNAPSRGFGGALFDLSIGGGGGHASGGRESFGGAPTPEVNASLGLLLVGVTVAVLRRRRGRRGTQVA